MQKHLYRIVNVVINLVLLTSLQKREDKSSLNWTLLK